MTMKDECRSEIGAYSHEMAPSSTLNAAADVLGYLLGLKAAYTQRHQRSSSQHEQFLIEFHASQLEHAIELMEEVRDMLTAELIWNDHATTQGGTRAP